MKKIIYLEIAFRLNFAFQSCNDSFLDTTPSDEYISDNWWNSKSHVISTINGVYSVLRNTHISQYAMLKEENLSTNCWGNGNMEPLSVGAHTSSSNANTFEGKWNACYEGIGRANYFLANVDKVDLDANLKSRTKGED